MDESLLDMGPVASGLKAGGKAVVNTTKAPEELDLGEGTNALCGTVDATAISLEVLKVPIDQHSPYWERSQKCRT